MTNDIEAEEQTPGKETEDLTGIPEMKRLVLAKKLYLHGCSHASNRDEVSRMLAIHHFDIAVDMILDCIITKHKISLKEGRSTFWSKWDTITRKIGGLTLRAQMERLHGLRNMIQHNGEIPQWKSVIECEGYVRDFFSDVSQRLFGIDYEEIYLSQLVSDRELRMKVLEAEKALKSNDFKKCIKLCEKSLLSTVNEHIIPIAGWMAGYFGLNEEYYQVTREIYPEKYRDKEFYELAKELSKAILGELQATSSMQFLDEYKMDFLKHRKTVETMNDLSDEELEYSANLSLTFVTDVILKWQEEGVLTFSTVYAFSVSE